MAYCPSCNANYQIVMNTRSDTNYDAIRVEKFSQKEDDSYSRRIGFDEMNMPVTNVSSIPCCSNCFRPFEFPHATNFPEFERMEKDAFVDLKARKLKHLEAAINSKSSIESKLSIILYYAIRIAVLVLIGYWGSTMVDSHNMIQKAFGFILFSIAILGSISATIDTLKDIAQNIEQRQQDRLRKDEQKAKVDQILDLEYSHKNYMDLKQL